MVPPDTKPVLARLVDKISKSRFFTISLGLHLVIILVLGGTVMVGVIQEPTEFVADGGEFVSRNDAADRTQQPTSHPTQPTNYQPVTPPGLPDHAQSIITPIPSEGLDFSDSLRIRPANPGRENVLAGSPVFPTTTGGDSLPTASDLSAIGEFTGGWDQGDQLGATKGLRQREFKFTAFLARYAGGNWNSTVQVRNNEVVRGSLPNLLYYMSKVSNDRIQTNERDVKVISLDSEDIFKFRPPFIFLTGTRDFVLTESEVTNLRRYVRMGGAIWGDSSVPGQRSRFDIAFKREMKRVIADTDKDFEPIERNHPIFTSGYFPEIKEPPAGLNHYRDSVSALKVFGEIAILYTSNDYGDMMQVGLTPEGKVDLGRDRSGNWVATNPAIWENRAVYLNNVTEDSVRQSYEFGINVVVHLLTRWEKKLKSSPKL